MPSVKIDDELYTLAQEDATRERRNLNAQLRYYYEIGRAIARSPNFSQDDIDSALNGGLEVGELSAEETEWFFEQYAKKVENGGLYTADFWSQRQQAGLGVGALPDGTLVRQLPGGGVEPLSARA